MNSTILFLAVAHIHTPHTHTQAGTAHTPHTHTHTGVPAGVSAGTQYGQAVRASSTGKRTRGAPEAGAKSAILSNVFAKNTRKLSLPRTQKLT